MASGTSPRWDYGGASTPDEVIDGVALALDEVARRTGKEIYDAA